MSRTLQDVMSERNISRYHLSKISGIPWATLSDICSGKTALERCSAGTVLKLSRALGMTMEETMDLETGVVCTTLVARKDRGYLEKGLPDELQRSIDAVVEGIEAENPNLDLLLDELYGEINANQWAGVITKEQADHIRSKYYYGDEHD